VQRKQWALVRTLGKAILPGRVTDHEDTAAFPPDCYAGRRLAVQQKREYSALQGLGSKAGKPQHLQALSFSVISSCLGGSQSLNYK
jgi:hypothetical protein